MTSWVEYGNLGRNAFYKHWVPQLAPFLSRITTFFMDIQAAATKFSQGSSL